MAVRLVAVTFDAHDPSEVAAFWGRLLDREIVAEADGALLPGEGAQVGLRFVAASTEKSGPNRLHLHLTSTSPEDQQRTVETALRLGGLHVDVGQLPEEGHIVLGDPDGNELCVIEANNGFLARCGPLRFDLAADDLETEVARLLSLGATQVGDRDGGVELADPDGNEFSVATGA